MFRDLPDGALANVQTFCARLTPLLLRLHPQGNTLPVSLIKHPFKCILLRVFVILKV